MNLDLNKNQIKRFSRQIILKDIGTLGQKRIIRSKVLIIEDVITTGKSSMECVKLINKANAKLVGFASIIDRSVKKNLKIKKKVISHLKIDVPVYKKDNLPKELSSVKITKPGSRFIK